MNYPIPAAILKKILLATEFFVFVSAVSGAVGLVLNLLPIPPSLIEGSVFNSYLIPGIILGLIIGGINLAALIALRKNSRFAADISAVAGLGLVIWLFVEMYIIRGANWLHTLYFVCGIIILVASFLLRSVERKA